MTMIYCLSLVTFQELLTVYSRVSQTLDLSYLFFSYCLALYGCALWKQSSHALKGLEVMLNNCLRRIWNLPPRTHTCILQCCTGIHVQSIYNIVFSRSHRFIGRSICSSNTLVRAVFSDNFAYTFAKYNTL